jgi:hypothetical protein
VNRHAVALAARGAALAVLPKLTPHQRDELALAILAMESAARATLSPAYLETALTLLGDMAPSLANHLRQALTAANRMNRNST